MKRKNNNLLRDLMNWFAKLGQAGTSENQQEKETTDMTEMPILFQTEGCVELDFGDDDSYEVLEHEEEYDPEKDQVIGHILFRSKGKIKKVYIESDSIETHMVKRVHMKVVREEQVSL